MRAVTAESNQRGDDGDIMSFLIRSTRGPQTYAKVITRSSADADNALDANEAVPNKWRADGTHNTYQSY